MSVHNEIESLLIIIHQYTSKSCVHEYVDTLKCWLTIFDADDFIKYI